MITATELRKSYRTKDVLNSVSFSLPDGGIHGLLGRNGVGKSTLLGILAGQIRPDSGDLQVMGHTPFDNAELMDGVVLAGVDTPYPELWKGKAIITAASLRYPRWDSTTADALVDDFAMRDVLNARYGSMSRGQKAMVGIIVGLAAHAPLTLLDEPYVGLDTHNRSVFYRHLLQAGETGRTILLATHHIHESAKVLDSVVIVGRDGRIFHQREVADLADEYVVVTAPELPVMAGALSVSQTAGMHKALIPRRDVPASVAGMRFLTAELDDVIEALLEAS